MSGQARAARPATGKKPAGTRPAATPGAKLAGIRKQRAAVSAQRPMDSMKLSRRNWIAFGIALGVIIVGFIFLAMGDITLAPLLLVVGYCVLVPYAIVTRERAPKSS